MYSQYTVFNINNKITLNYLKSAAMGYFLGFQYEFERAVVNEPTLFGLVKFDCNYD